MNKFELIKEDLAEFDEAHKRYLEACNEPMPREAFAAISEFTTRKQAPLVDGPLTALRTLMPVVEAASKLARYSTSISMGQPATVEALEALEELQTALAALQEPGGNS